MVQKNQTSFAFSLEKNVIARFLSGKQKQFIEDSFIFVNPLVVRFAACPAGVAWSFTDLCHSAAVVTSCLTEPVSSLSSFLVCCSFPGNGFTVLAISPSPTDLFIYFILLLAYA